MKYCVAGCVIVVFGLLGRSALATGPVVIMPLGDSITDGVDYSTHYASGYRGPLYADLNAAGITPQFVGAASDNSTQALTDSNNQFHNGYGSYPIDALTPNLDGNVQYMLGGQPYGASNQGGYWLTGGHGTGRAAVSPDIVLIEAGTNNFLGQQSADAIGQQMKTLITTFHSLSPNTKILVGGAIPINGDAGFNARIRDYDVYLRDTLIPTLPYARYVDLYGAFTNADGTAKSAYYGTDNIHPNSTGYPVMAATWAAAIEQAVPEPAVVAPIGLAGAALLMRKRQPTTAPALQK